MTIWNAKTAKAAKESPYQEFFADLATFAFLLRDAGG